MKILEIVKYISSVLNAVSEGLQVVISRWPVNSPFSSDAKKEVGNYDNG